VPPSIITLGYSDAGRYQHDIHLQSRHAGTRHADRHRTTQRYTPAAAMKESIPLPSSLTTHGLTAPWAARCSSGRSPEGWPCIAVATTRIYNASASFDYTYPLNSNGSHDLLGRDLTYAWSWSAKTGGTWSLTNADQATASLHGSIPTGSGEKKATVQLTVSNADGNSDTSSLTGQHSGGDHGHQHFAAGFLRPGRGTVFQGPEAGNRSRRNRP
jgi:hypothetical protein